ncbi:uncharacterized protein DUF59 [Rhodovulum imhoffii]|uniref:Uncharacterized protein DUF59 n=1 Tax=Rhodovulum imhoffii TaxID=365340 RepID=A0A2T5BL85_9RHOB|nr:iron-sulfur cluster assembly protein [Rhodovulum imhoffii]MBK5933655.1 hypothetical protein [Rhodovulum imhoffii]PTM99711.1 uncharacterized protein DUF59 [Rhodovulum imhoffii]
MALMSPEEARDLLRKVPCPGRSRDIVALGFVKSIATTDDGAYVEFTPDIQNVAKILDMEAGIRNALHTAGFAEIELETEPPYDDSSMLLGGPATNPLQIDLSEYDIDPNPDLVEGPGGRARNLLNPDAPDGGAALGAEGDVDEFAATRSEGPQGNADPDYDGALPVFQWEIGPDVAGCESVKVKLSIDSWNYVVCWMAHPGNRLVYVSLQARHWIRDATGARPNPSGRVEGVNLVYDPIRAGVVAIYGTVRDFRPFVEAFRRAFENEEGTREVISPVDLADAPV